MKSTNKIFIFRIKAHILGIFLVLMFATGSVFSQADKGYSYHPNTIYEDLRIEIGNTFIEYLSERKFDELASLFSDSILFRALLPPAMVTADTPHKTANYFKTWFHLDEGDDYKVIKSKAELMVDCLHIYYVVDVTKANQGYRVEQHIFCEVTDKKINKLSLLCSGPRKVNQ